jgi:hypothetical protein
MSPENAAPVREVNKARLDRRRFATVAIVNRLVTCACCCTGIASGRNTAVCTDVIPI